MNRRQRFRHWRHTRPFWAGAFLIGSGLVILSPLYAMLRLGDLALSISTAAGASALIIGATQVIIGLALWICPQIRVPAGVVSTLLALASLPQANLGGLIIGMLLGLVGGSLAISWRIHPTVHPLLLLAFLFTLAANATSGRALKPTTVTPVANHKQQSQIDDCPLPEPDRTTAPAASAPLLAVTPFRLDASRIDLHRVDLVNSNQIVSVQTQQGSKRVLKFIAGSIEITGLHQTTAADGTAKLTLRTPIDSRSRLSGPVTLYVEKLCGTLAVGSLGVTAFGVPGAVFPAISAASPAPLVLPELTFTGVTVYVAGLSAKQLEIPNLLLSAS